jgi:lysozyme
MKLNEKGINLLHKFEGCELTAYECPASKIGKTKFFTIGWGSTRYEDGSPVQKGDVITQERADSLFELIAEHFARGVRKRVKSKINDNQFNALVSFAYNVGLGNLDRSTLLKKVNLNPNDPSIGAEFLRWNRAKGVVLNGLTRRRKAEAELYFDLN